MFNNSFIHPFYHQFLGIEFQTNTVALGEVLFDFFMFLLILLYDKLPWMRCFFSSDSDLSLEVFAFLYWKLPRKCLGWWKIRLGLLADQVIRSTYSKSCVFVAIVLSQLALHSRSTCACQMPSSPGSFLYRIRSSSLRRRCYNAEENDWWCYNTSHKSNKILISSLYPLDFNLPFFFFLTKLEQT